MNGASVASLATILGFELVIVFAMAWLVREAGIGDVPDTGRKVQRTTMPTSGGLAMVFGVAVAVLLAVGAGGQVFGDKNQDLGLILLGACGAAVLGALDDVAPLPARVKLYVMVALSLWMGCGPVRVESIAFWDGGVVHLGPVLGGLGTAAWLFVLMNAVNFIDGCDGLAMGSAAIGFALLALFAGLGGVAPLAFISAAACVALLGFLPHNTPRAKLYAGDSGALWAGFLLAALSAWAVKLDVLPTLSAPLLALPMLADTLLTLVVRARLGRPLLVAHREHCYQIGLRAGARPLHIAAIGWLLSLHCAVSAGVGFLFGPAGAFLALVVNLALLSFLFVKVRRFAEAHDLTAPI